MLPGDGFGSAVDVYGDVVLVGSPVNEVDGILAGRAYVFRFIADQNQWIQEGVLQAFAPSDLDYFGSSVALSEDLAIIGSPGDDERGSNAGAAFVFRRDPSGWSFVSKLLASDARAGDRFGESVATTGDRVLIGSPFGFGAGDARSGVAYLFNAAGSSFDFEARLDAALSFADQEFGTSVALQDGIAFVGAPSSGNLDSPGGTVSIFDLTADASHPLQVLNSGPNMADAGFGASLDIDSGFLIVGSQRMIGDHRGPGSAGVYSRVGASWTLLSPLSGSGSSKADGFGESVSISSTMAAVGAPGDAAAGPNTGAAYFYSGDSDGWK